MVEPLEIGINANLQRFVKKMGDADRMLAKREARLARLRRQIDQADQRIRQAAGQTRAIGIGAVRALGTGALTLAIQNSISQSGLETGGFFGQLAVGVGVGAAFGGGLPGAITAGITVLVSQLINLLGKVGERLKKIEEQVAKTVAELENAIKTAEMNDQRIREELRLFAEKLGEKADKKTREDAYQLQRALLAGAA